MGAQLCVKKKSVCVMENAFYQENVGRLFADFLTVHSNNYLFSYIYMISGFVFTCIKISARQTRHILHVEQLRTSSVRISFCQDTTCIFNPLAGDRVTIVTMHSLGRLIHWTVSLFYSETDYQKFVALLLE